MKCIKTSLMAITIFMSCNSLLGSANLFDRKLTSERPTIDQYLQELKIAKVSSQVLRKTIAAIMTGQYASFDGVVGDCKCQTRTSTLLDFAPLFKTNAPKLQADLQQLQQIEQSATAEIDTITAPTYPHLARQALSMKLKSSSILQIFKDSMPEYEPLPELKTAAQCFVTNPENAVFATADLAKSTVDSVTKLCKKDLCAQSISYEQQLAAEYCSQDVQKSLTHVAQKGQTTMTGFFPAIKPVLAKMIARKQAIQLRKDVFCPDCSCLQDTTTHSFSSDGTKFQPTDQLPFNEVVMIVEGNQYPASLETLKSRLGVDPQATYIPSTSKKPCLCTTKIAQPPLPDQVEEVLLRGAAEHAQYITEEPIPFEKLGIQGSQLEQDFLARYKPSGFGIKNMSIFCIDHIYPSLPLKK